MKIKRITAEYSKTKQFVQFEPDKFHAKITASLDEGEDARVAYKKLFAQCKVVVNDQIRTYENDR